MGMRYRRSIKVAPGIKLNVTKTGIGATVGGKAVRHSVHSSGRHTTGVGLPGAGLYYQESSGGNRNTPAPVPASNRGLTPAQARREHERHAKKLQLASERRSKPLEILKGAFAEGKISEQKFLELQKRDEDITLDLVIFGRTPALKLAQRYMVGLIDKYEFEHIRTEIVGAPDEEKLAIAKGIQSSVDAVIEFAKLCRNQKAKKTCNHCGKNRGFFSPLYSVLDIQICGNCRKQFAALRKYPGFNGMYYTAAPMTLSPDEQNSLHLNINREYVLTYK